MDVMYRRMPPSTLNPNAPLFVPMAYRTVEDFSDEWWALIKSSTWFADYWLQECFQDPQNAPPITVIDDSLLTEIEALLDGYINKQDDEKEGYSRDLVSLGALKWRKSRASAATPRYMQKVPKIVNMKVSPKPIQQPR